jgi:hypothetical protein
MQGHWNSVVSHLFIERSRLRDIVGSVSRTTRHADTQRKG